MEVSLLLLIGILNVLVVFFLTLSGGIGLVMRPVMILLGIPPGIVIGTSRLSSLPGQAISAYILHKSEKIDWKLSLLLSIPYLFGGIIGIYLISKLSTNYLENVVGVLLFISGIIFLYNKELGLKKKVHKIKRDLANYLSFLLTPVIGFMLVIIGGGGNLLTLMIIGLYKKTYIEAVSIGRVMGLIQTLVTSFFFLILSLVDWELLIVLILSSVIGNFFGTKFALEKGDIFLRRLVLIVVFVSSTKLMFF